MVVDTGLQPLALAINATSPSLAVIFVVLRLYSQYFITRTLGWDVILIVVPMVLAITMAVSFHLAIIASYSGYHFRDILGLELRPTLVKQYNYLSQILYNPILALVKNAVLIFFLRLGRIFERLRLFILSLLVFNNLMMVGIFVAVIFQCVPISKTFHPEVPGTCINLPQFFIATAALTILTDILVLIIPTWLLWDLNMKPRKKIATIFLLSLGFLVTSISVYRVYYLINIYYGPPDPDPTYSVGGTSSTIEVNLAIIAACGPFLKPLIVRFLPNFFERDTTDDHAGGWPDSLTWGGRFRSYSASATAAKPGSSSRFGSDVELQSSSTSSTSTRSLRAGKYERPLDAWDTEEDEDDDSAPPQRRWVSMVPSMILMGQQPQHSGTSAEVESVARSQEVGNDPRPACGITRQVTVYITYSPSDGQRQVV